MADATSAALESKLLGVEDDSEWEYGYDGEETEVRRQN